MKQWVRYIMALLLVAGIYSETGIFTAVGFIIVLLCLELQFFTLVHSVGMLGRSIRTIKKTLT